MSRGRLNHRGGVALRRKSRAKIKQQEQLQIQRMPAEDGGGTGPVIYLCDYKVGGQCCDRLTFRAEEAPAAGS